MTSGPSITGRLDGHTVTFTREFRTSAAQVWEAVTDPERMQRWIGTWTGDPATGEVDWRMTAEGDQVPVERVRIIECVEPTRLEVEFLTDGDWRIAIVLRETGGMTTLEFAQTFRTGEPVAMVGPGWEYYLDRLRAHLIGADVTSVEWSDYEPMSESYSELGRQMDAG